MGGKWIDNFNGNMVQSTPCYGWEVNSNLNGNMYRVHPAMGVKWIHNFNGNMVQSTPCYGCEVNSQLQW